MMYLKNQVQTQKVDLDNEIRKYCARVNAETLFKHCKKITDTSTTAGKYLVDCRRLPLAFIENENLNIFSLEGTLGWLKYNSKKGQIETITRNLKCAVSPVWNSTGTLVAIHLVHLTDKGKKIGANREAKEDIVFTDEKQKVARVQTGNTTTKVYIAEGVETAASVASIINMAETQSQFCFLASLGIDQLSSALGYIKINFPPKCTVVLLKDHDAPKAETEEKFKLCYQQFCDAGFKVVVKQPQKEGQDWNDVLVEVDGDSQKLKEAFIKAETYENSDCVDPVIIETPNEADEKVVTAFSEIYKLFDKERQIVQSVTNLVNLHKTVIVQLRTKFETKYIKKESDKITKTDINDLKNILLDITKIKVILQTIYGNYLWHYFYTDNHSTYTIRVIASKRK